MRLLDIATVITGDSHFPLEGDSRGCAVGVTLDEACTSGVVTGSPVVTSGLLDPADTYIFRPFGLMATLDRKVSCHRDDDLSWLADELKDATEQAVGRSLVVQPYLDAEAWIGSAAAGTAATVPAGRTAWTNAHVSTFQKTPILHVAPESLPALITADVVVVSPDATSVRTVWGDPVVVNSGYAGFPSFWTGDITVHLSSIQNTDEIYRDLRANRLTLRANRIAAVDITPCSIVRIGAMPV